MPIYEYSGCQCGRFETFQKMADDALTQCPTCGQPVHRVPQVPRFKVKNSSEKPETTVSNDYERRLGRKVESDESFYTVPATGEVLPMKGLNDRQKREQIALGHRRAGQDVSESQITLMK